MSAKTTKGTVGVGWGGVVGGGVWRIQDKMRRGGQRRSTSGAEDLSTYFFAPAITNGTYRTASRLRQQVEKIAI